MTRLADLYAKLRARENIPGYEKNVELLRAEIARLEAAKKTTSASSA